MKWFIGLIFACLFIIGANANERGEVSRIQCEFPAFKVVMFNTDSLVETRFYQNRYTEGRVSQVNGPSDGIFWIMTSPERGVMRLKRNTDGMSITFSAVRFRVEEFGVSNTRAMVAFDDRIQSGRCIIVFIAKMG